VTHDSRIYEFADTITHMEDGRAVGVDRKRQSENLEVEAGLLHQASSQSLMETTL